MRHVKDGKFIDTAAFETIREHLEDIVRVFAGLKTFGWDPELDGEPREQQEKAESEKKKFISTFRTGTARILAMSIWPKGLQDLLSGFTGMFANPFNSTMLSVAKREFLLLLPICFNCESSQNFLHDPGIHFLFLRHL
jgi:hypothetical protein